MDQAIKRQMDDELTYAKQGTFSPSYLRGDRSRALTQYFKDNPQEAQKHEKAIAEAWNSRQLSAICDRELARVGLAGKTTNDGKTLDEVSIELTGKKYQQLPDDSPAQEMVMAEFEERGGSAQQAF